MTSLEYIAIREFRRFAISNIYPDTVYMIMTEIQKEFSADQMKFDQFPQPTIKFNCEIERDENNSIFIGKLHTVLKRIIIDYFNTPEIIKIIRNRIHTNVVNEDTKNLLNSCLTQIQLGNLQYVCLMFNITVLGSTVYIYL